MQVLLMHYQVQEDNILMEQNTLNECWLNLSGNSYFNLRMLFLNSHPAHLSPLIAFHFLLSAFVLLFNFQINFQTLSEVN